MDKSRTTSTENGAYFKNVFSIPKALESYRIVLMKELIDLVSWKTSLQGWYSPPWRHGQARLWSPSWLLHRSPLLRPSRWPDNPWYPLEASNSKALSKKLKWDPKWFWGSFNNFTTWIVTSSFTMHATDLVPLIQGSSVWESFRPECPCRPLWVRPPSFLRLWIKFTILLRYLV